MSKELQEIVERAVAQALERQLPKLQAELQSKIGEIQSHAGEEQSKLGELQGELGEKQGKLGEQQGFASFFLFLVHYGDTLDIRDLGNAGLLAGGQPGDRAEGRLQRSGDRSARGRP